MTNPANSYRVDVSDDGGRTWEMVHRDTRPINPDTYEHEGVKPDTALTFRLFGKEGTPIGLGSNAVLHTSGHSKAPDSVRGHWRLPPTALAR